LLIDGNGWGGAFAPGSSILALAREGELRQLVCLAGWGCRCGLPDLAPECLVPPFGLLPGPFVHVPAAGDQVDQDAHQRDEQHEEEPQSLGQAGQIRAAEDIDEHLDQDPEPDYE